MTNLGGFGVPSIGPREPRQQTWDSLVFALLFPVLNEQDPMRHVDRVITGVATARALGASPEDYRRAIADGRVNGRPLADVFAGMLGLPHTEETMWRFLDAIEERLAALSR